MPAETAFEEIATAAFVVDKLQEFGLEVTSGLAKPVPSHHCRAGAQVPQSRCEQTSTLSI